MSIDLDPVHLAQFEVFGVDATVKRYGETIHTRVIVRDGVAKIGDFGRVIGRARQVCFLRDWFQPRRGDVVTIGGRAQPVDAIVADDGFVVEVVLHG